MANERIRFDMTMTDVVVAMSEGNPGAMRTCMELIKEAPTVDPDSGLGALGPLLQLDSLISGVLGSICCGMMSATGMSRQ